MFNKKVNYLITLINFFTAMSWMIASNVLSESSIANANVNSIRSICTPTETWAAPFSPPMLTLCTKGI